MSTAADKNAFEAVRELLRDQDGQPEALRVRFGSAQAMFAAEPLLLRGCGVHRHDALLLSRISGLSRYMERSAFGAHPTLETLPKAAAFLRTNFAGLQVEHFYMLALDVRGKLIEAVRLNEGTGDTALFDLRRLLSEAVRLSPAGIVLSHNHPRGTLRPSEDDIECTAETIRALSSPGIPLLDHIIIADRQAVSLRDNGLPGADVWLRQSEDSQLLKNWLGR